jgi:S1-C subfamily serine protease
MSRHLCFFIMVAVVIFYGPDVHAQQGRGGSHCDAPAYFGMCDPYVPGTIIRFEEKQPIHVITTWYQGPAERAGVCPGDKIEAVNGVVAAENTKDRMLHELVSIKPSPVVLTVKRGDRTLEFRVRRVRESTLAKRGHQKFLADPNLWDSQGLVPRSEKRAEYARYIEFLKQLEQREGFTRVEGLAVPAGTPPQQVRTLKEFMFGGQHRSRQAGVVGPTAGRYSFGFTALLLREPTDALIEAVLPNSPAQRAGLLPGDRLLELDGQEISATRDLKALIFKPDQERTISLRVDRGGEQRTFAVRSEPFDQVVARDLRSELPNAPPSFPDSYFLGIRVLYSPNPREAMVSEVDWPSPAFDAGLHVGDPILAVNGKAMSEISREELGKLLVPAGASIMSIDVSRLGRKKTFTINAVTHRTAEAGIGRKSTKSGFVPEGCPAS